MTTLYFIDKRKTCLPTEIQQWRESLIYQLKGQSQALSNIYVLLVGFNELELVEWRRMLHAQGVAEAHCYSVLPDTAQTLNEHDVTLFDLLIEHTIQAHAPATLIEISNASAARKVECKEVVLSERPTLAFVSPMPPQPTGIACYSAELLPYLAVYFDITVVVDQPTVALSITESFKVIDAATFSQQTEQYEFTLYQIGNSLYHAYQFTLLRSYPGTVVLHDYYLFDAVWWLQESNLLPAALPKRLYADHGYPALVALEHADKNSRGPEYYPVNGLVTDLAGGIIYHSEHARSLASRWCKGNLEPTYIIPHLRELPPWPDKQSARHALELDANTTVVASFGGINPKKLTHKLIETFLESELATRNVKLVLVGAQHGGDYGSELTRYIKQHKSGHAVLITGYADREAYTRWLAAADLAVQLRTQSRGETSGAIFDAMAYGLPVIANAHGSSAELPKQALQLLPDTFTGEQLLDAIRALINSPDSRQALSRLGRDYVDQTLNPAHIAKQYAQAIAHAPAHSMRYRFEGFLDQLASMPALKQALAAHDTPHARALSKALSDADLTPSEQLPRLLIDVSTIAWEDLKTGIERVTRRIADHLLRHPPEGWRVELIRWGGDDFYLARGFASRQLNIPSPGPDSPIEARAGDCYVTLEWAPPLLKQAGHIMQRMRAQGVRFYFTVHDLLPLSLPACFPPETPSVMREWFEAIVPLADGITCVSRYTASTVEAELDALAQKGCLPHRPWVKHFHLGADFKPGNLPAAQVPANVNSVRQIVKQASPTLLMVGTVEPRKGHQQVLDALEQCWSNGENITLVIVGKKGWQIEKLANRIERHPRLGKQLFWEQGASDEVLNALYQNSDVLIAASQGEGFGLPLIEAAHHGIAILARDLAVFREVAGEYARYFHADNAEQLAAAIREWVAAWEQGQITSSADMPYLSWQQSAQAWLACVLEDQSRTYSYAPMVKDTL